MVEVQANGGPSRGLWRDDGEFAPPGGSAEAGAAATVGLDNGERAPPGGSAEARGQCKLDDPLRISLKRSGSRFNLKLAILRLL